MTKYVQYNTGQPAQHIYERDDWLEAYSVMECSNNYNLEQLINPLLKTLS